MTTKSVARCSIYENRPEVCKVYPKVDHYTPPQCTYRFNSEERSGECACNEGACCASARKDGEPGGVSMPAVSGGLPCKYLVWEDKESEKTAEPLVKIASQTTPDIEGCVYGRE
jgi:hypothetical protein